MAQNSGQRRAADAVAAELADRGWTNTDLSQATAERDTGKPGVDAGTIGDFLAYRRWPKIGTLGRFERAFGWEPGSLRLLALHGEEVKRIDERRETVSDPRNTDDVPAWNTRKPDGMTDEQHKAIVRETEEYYRWKIQQASGER